MDFAGQAVCVENRREIDLGNDVKITMLSPTLNKLKQLGEYWKRARYKKEITDGDIFDDAFEFLVSREKKRAIVNREKKVSSSQVNLEALSSNPFTEDTSAANGSSIAFILRFMEKKILFLGDSHPCIIEQELRSLYGEGPIWFDAVKVSHHGSSGNTSSSLLKLIDSANFLISTNGIDYECIYCRILDLPCPM